MSGSGKALIACCVVGSLIFLYLGGRTYHTHRQWGSHVAKQAERIAALEKQETDFQKQIKEEQDKIQLARIGWGRVWDNVSVALEDVNPETGAVTVIAQGELAGLQPQRVAQPEGAQPPEPRLVHAFVIGESGNQYLGEFVVVSGDATSATLKPAVRVSVEQLQQAQASPWRLRARIPDGEFKARLRDRDIELSLLQDEANRRAATADMWKQTTEGYERERDLRAQAVAELEEKLADAEAQRNVALAENARLTEELAAATARRNSLIEENKNLSAHLGDLEARLLGERQRTASVSAP